jgi:hypothetical protein
MNPSAESAVVPHATATIPVCDECRRRPAVWRLIGLLFCAAGAEAGAVGYLCDPCQHALTNPYWAWTCRACQARVTGDQTWRRAIERLERI